MLYSRRWIKENRTSQSGINMVDLMMWLVIAALLLATAIQGIGYYHKASLVYQLSSDVSGAGQNVMTEASLNNGTVTDAVVTSGIENTKKSSPTTTMTKRVENDGYFTIITSHPAVANVKVVYSSETRNGLVAGVNIVDVTPGTAGASSEFNSGEGLPGSTTSTEPFTGFFASSRGQCLDLWGAQTTNGTQIMIYSDCHGGANQWWVWSGNGDIRSSFDTNKCLQMSEDTQPKLEIWDCNGSENQVFQTIRSTATNFKIFHPFSGKCLRDTSSTWGYVNLDECSAEVTGRWAFTATR